MFKYLIEYIGTFIFLSVILSVQHIKNKILVGISIGLGLACAIFIGNNISGGHFNPIMSLIMWVSNKLSFNELIGYIIAQVLGGLSALWIYKLVH